EVQEALDATSSRHLTFLATEHGRPFTAAGFGNRFRQWCDEAGLRGFSAHGLRHTACTRLAEAGATGHEIMSWSGHRTLKEAATRSTCNMRAPKNALGTHVPGTMARIRQPSTCS